ncbi:MAG TPA: hypothetical protein ENF51_01505 [Candidatus Aenigmarchaeota archaeon]|nr:hypothetical protein [Candidatus Aenigmarchaeota archaeon]
MKIGILDDRKEAFSRDVLNKLREKGYQVEYVWFGYQRIPTKSDYRVILDRQSMYDEFLRAIMKVLSLNGTYVINNPFSNICDDKLVELNLCQSLGIPYPKTLVLPRESVEYDMSQEIVLTDVKDILPELKFPLIIKPHDGYAWKDVYEVNTPEELDKLYRSLRDEYTVLVQEKIEPKLMYRAYSIGHEKVVLIRYDPSSRRYLEDDYSQIKDILPRIEEWTKRLNEVLDYDLNSVEWIIDQNGQPYLIDAFNEVPEILPEAIPKTYYDELVNSVAELVEKIFHSDKHNRWPFDYPP